MKRIFNTLTLWLCEAKASIIKMDMLAKKSKVGVNSAIMTQKATAVYNYLLQKAYDKKRPVTNKVLQKLVYYSQAWNLVENDEVLFTDSIEAWVHGPALPGLYRKFSIYGYQAITAQPDASVFRLLSTEEKALIDDVWDLYGDFDGDYLESLTHREDPWIKARAGLEPFQNSSAVIDIDLMKKYYGERLQSAKASS